MVRCEVRVVVVWVALLVAALVGCGKGPMEPEAQYYFHAGHIDETGIDEFELPWPDFQRVEDVFSITFCVQSDGISYWLLTDPVYNTHTVCCYLDGETVVVCVAAFPNHDYVARIELVREAAVRRF